MRIALIGAPGSGKSTVAEKLCEPGGVKIAFADALRREVAELLVPIATLYESAGDYGEPASDVDFILDDMANPKRKDAFRAILQQWGMMRRAADANHWVTRVTDVIDPILAGDSGVTVVVDDCRMPNEYDVLKARDFRFVRLEAGPHLRLQAPEQRQHESERYWPNFQVDLVLDYQDAKIQAQRIRDAFERGRE